MGTTSSQLEQSQSQDFVQQYDNTQDSLPQLDGANMDDLTQRDDEIHVKKRLKNADATNPQKRSKKNLQDNSLGAMRTEIEDSQDATGNANQGATEATSQKPSKKKSKKEQTAPNERGYEIGLTQVTQSSAMLDETPQSTANTTNSDGSKRTKTKRKRPTGRPSGLNIMPAGMSDPATQEDSVGPGADPSDAMELPSQPTVVIPAKVKKSKESKGLPVSSGTTNVEPSNPAPKRTSLPSPETTNVQSSQPVHRKTKAPKVKSAVVNGTSVQADKAAKSPKKHRAESPEDMEKLPTPRGAAQARSPKLDKLPTQHARDRNADVDAMRDDFSEVDATLQVEGWLSSQLADEDSEEPSLIKSPRNASHKKTFNTASAKRKAATFEKDKATTKKRKRTSNHHDNDSEDFALEEERDMIVEETPRSTDRHRKKRTDIATELSTNEGATQDAASPLVSKKGRMSSHKKENKAKQDTVIENELTTGAATSAAKKSSKKKPQPKSVDGEDEEDSLPTRKLGPKDRRTAKGPLTPAEKAMIDGLFQDTLKETGISDSDLRAAIQNWRTATDFKEAVETALPDRPVAAIRKFCQRRYHNMERGPWRPEDDDALKKAYTGSPDKWTEISALVGRTASDCKDRWKNTVSIQDTMQVGPWSQEEISSLIKAVDACVRELQKAKKEYRGLDRAELERMLSWAEVAKKLGGTRSAKRCNEKWQKLKREEYSGRASISAQPLPTGVEGEESSKKLRLCEKSYNECDIGDLYDMLTEIHTALPDPKQHFDHESTLWGIISTKNPNSRFKSAMRRRGLHDALRVYEENVPEMPTIAGKAKALADHLEREWGVEALAKKRAFDPKPKVRKIKSAERVDSDEDDEELENAGDTQTPPTSNDDDDEGDNVDGNDEEADEKQAGVEIPDSQAHATADSKGSDDYFASSFKPINKKKRKEPSSPQAESDIVEQLPTATKRKKSSKTARAKMQA